MSNKPSRWACASREKLEALADFTDQYWVNCKTCSPLEDLRASCPPLRTEAEVAAEALAILRQEVRMGNKLGATQGDRLRALAKEPTR